MMSFTLRSETDELMVCRGCLAIDVKLYNIQENRLVEPYEELIGFPLLSSRKQYLCSFCRTHLLKFAKFRARCRKAEELLVNAEMQGMSTPTYIEELSRQYIDFKPNYIKTYIDVIHINDHINIELNSNIKEELIPKTEDKTAVFIDETDVGIVKEEIEIEINEPLCMSADEFGDHNTDYKDSFIDETDVGIVKEEIDIEINEPLCMSVDEFEDHNTDYKDSFIDETDVGIVKEEIDIEINEPLCMSVNEFEDHNTDYKDSSRNGAKKLIGMAKKTNNIKNFLEEFEDDDADYNDSSKVCAKKPKEMSKETNNIKNFLKEFEDNDTDYDDAAKVRAKKSKEMFKKTKNIKNLLEEFEDDDTDVSSLESSLELSSSDDDSLSSSELDSLKVRAKKSKEIIKKLNNINNYVVESEENNGENASSNATNDKIKDATETHRKENIFIYDVEKKIVIGNFEAIHLTKDEQIYEIKLKTNQKNACKECGKKYKNLIKHNTKHHNTEYVLKCEICKISFNKKKQLKKHREEHEKKYICKNCNYTTQLRDRLKLHKCRKITAPVKLVTEYAKFNFEVEYLTIEEQMKEIDDKRKSEKKNSNGHKCEYCGKNYTTQKTLENHFQKSHAVRTGDYVCDICKTVFRNKSKLRTHIRSHGMRLLCKECNFIGKRHDLRPHYYWHSGKKFTCTYCDQSFTIQTSYLSHVRLRHGTELNWCEYCGQSFIGKRGLYQHKQLAHKQIETTDNKCAKCNKNFLDDNALKNHINLNRCDLFNCVKCGDAFVNEFLLKYHLVQHKNINYKCKKCNVRFLNMAAYDKHEGSCGSGHVCMQCGENYETGILLIDHVNTEHTVQIFKCEQCGKTFLNAYYYREHISRAHQSKTTSRSYCKRPNIKSNIKSKWTAMCEVCGKNCQNPGVLKYHQRLHSVEKPYPCTLCTKRFTLKALLTIHTGIRRHVCQLCDKKFQTSTGVKTHVKTVHMKLPMPPRIRRRNRVKDE